MPAPHHDTYHDHPARRTDQTLQLQMLRNQLTMMVVLIEQTEDVEMQDHLLEQMEASALLLDAN